MGYVVVTKKQRGTPEMPTSILTSVPTLPPTRPSGWRSHVASHQHTPFHSSHGHVCVVQNITCPMGTECNTATGDCQDYRGRMLQPESVVLECGTRTRCRRRYWQYHWSERLGHELYFRCHVVWRAIYDTTHNGTSGNHELLSPPRNVDRHIHVGPLGAVVVLSTPWNCGTKTNQTAASLTVLASSSGVLYTPVGDFTPLASNPGQQRFPIGTRTFFFRRHVRGSIHSCCHEWLWQSKLWSMFDRRKATQKVSRLKTPNAKIPPMSLRRFPSSHPHVHRRKSPTNTCTLEPRNMFCRNLVAIKKRRATAAKHTVVLLLQPHLGGPQMSDKNRTRLHMPLANIVDPSRIDHEIRFCVLPLLGRFFDNTMYEGSL